MVLQVMRLKWKLVSIYLEIELILTLKIGARFASKAYHWLRNRFGRTKWYSLTMMLKW
jgi:hypothetical protein